MPPLAVADHVMIQNQIGNHPRRWDKTGQVIEVRQHDQYVIRVDGSGRVTLRNRQFLRRFTPAVRARPPPRAIEEDLLSRSTCPASALRIPMPRSGGGIGDSPAARPPGGVGGSPVAPSPLSEPCRDPPAAPPPGGSGRSPVTPPSLPGPTGGRHSPASPERGTSRPSLTLRPTPGSEAPTTVADGPETGLSPPVVDPLSRAASPPSTPATAPRRSSRVRKRPAWMDAYNC